MNELAKVDVRVERGIPVAAVRGEIDLSNAVALGRELAAAVPRDAPGLVLDAGAIDYVDSAGIRMLLELAEELSVHRQQLRLVATTSARIWKLLQLTGLSGDLAVDATTDEALHALDGVST